MARTIQRNVVSQGITVRVVKDTEWNEYRVETVRDRTVAERETYFTDDSEDAIETANEIARRLTEKEEVR